MSEREPLEIGDILKQYAWLQHETWGSTRQDPFLPEDHRAAPAHDPAVPVRVGNGPAACSTSVALVPTYPPHFVWDVNGWYRDLGAHYRMSRGQLREAYLEADGPGNPRLTWVLKALLNPEIKRAYDLMPLGDLYLNDPEVVAWLKASALDLAQQYGLSPEHALDLMGLRLDDSPEGLENSPSDLLDSGLDPGEDLLSRDEWAYSYWSWHADSPESMWDLLQAEYWQEQLISASARKGLLTRLRVGVMGGPHDQRVQMVDGMPVVFVNRETQVNPDLADLAVDELLTYLNP